MNDGIGLMVMLDMAGNHIAAQNDVIAAKDALISEQQETIEHLREQLRQRD